MQAPDAHLSQPCRAQGSAFGPMQPALIFRVMQKSIIMDSIREMVGLKSCLGCTSKSSCLACGKPPNPVVLLVQERGMYECSIRSGSVRFVAPLPQQRPQPQQSSRAMLGLEDPTRARPRVSDFACLVWEGSVYLFGGVESGPENPQLTTNSVFRLSLREALEPAGASPSWTVLPSMDERRRGGAAVGAKGKIWVIGGRTPPRRRAACALSSFVQFIYRLSNVADILDVDGGPHTDAVERFDPQGNTWERMPPLVRHRAYCSAVSVGRAIYAVGGCECPFLTMERLHLDESPVWELLEL
mmetsp:Transcript_42173/g.136465  ORF Transcript_42173/g.136465 Transcript_42173/m.136465 type:complete len:299 (-) Transcript_42173:1324-2220(-)